ncbi:MAG: sugar phosphate isomerase/epimerase [Planctomycetota bacterium]|nr:sugar phosphate isomerase/epimerase [Planctomycetota bacterium]
MKIAVSSYSYSQCLGQGKDLFWVVEQAARMGFAGIEFTNLPGDKPRDLARALHAAAAKARLPIVSYTIGADLLGDPPAAVQAVKAQLDIAAALGAPVLRHDAAWAPPETCRDESAFDAALPTLADACRRITEYAASLGIRTCVENHGYFVQHSLRCLKLVQAVAHKNFGWLIDLGNFLCADDDPLAATRRLAPYAVHVHAKDFKVTPASAAGEAPGLRSLGGALLAGTAVGEGDVNTRACLGALRASGYEGFLSIEYEGASDCIEGLATGLRNLNAWLAGA